MFCALGEKMDDQSQTTKTGRQFAAVEQARPAEPVAAAGRQAVTPEASAKDTRMADVTLATDGQLMEAGYGHGV